MTIKSTIAALLALLFVLAYATAETEYQCHTDIECEAEEARKCWILCN
jgi:hypothetical protein